MSTRTVALALVGGLVLAPVLATTPAHAAVETDFTITSPYAGVNWATTGQYKAGFHNHTTMSDGQSTAAQMLEKAYALGFNVYAMTDHNVNSGKSSFDHDGNPAGGPKGADPAYYLTTARMQQMATGADRGGRGMIGIPFSNEQSVKDHLNTFWADWNNTKATTSLEEKMARNDALTTSPKPLMHINHPGRYYGGDNTAKGPNGEDLGAQAASDPTKVSRYVGLFQKYPQSSLTGMEIVNKMYDEDSYSDRILWDNLLKQLMPKRNVFGYCNDDAHHTDMLGYAYNQLLMPSLTEANVYKAMTSGAWYCSALHATRELGPDFTGDRTKPAPMVKDIVVDQDADTITVKATNATKVQWVADGVVIAEGETLRLDDVASKVNHYVRAQIIGPNGITYLNAFGLSKQEVAVAAPAQSEPNQPEAQTDMVVERPGLANTGDESNHGLAFLALAALGGAAVVTLHRH